MMRDPLSYLGNLLCRLDTNGMVDDTNGAWREYVGGILDGLPEYRVQRVAQALKSEAHVYRRAMDAEFVLMWLADVERSGGDARRELAKYPTAAEDDHDHNDDESDDDDRQHYDEDGYPLEGWDGDMTPDHPDWNWYKPGA